MITDNNAIPENGKTTNPKSVEEIAREIVDKWYPIPPDTAPREHYSAMVRKHLADGIVEGIVNALRTERSRAESAEREVEQFCKKNDFAGLLNSHFVRADVYKLEHQKRLELQAKNTALQAEVARLMLVLEGYKVLAGLSDPDPMKVFKVIEEMLKDKHKKVDTSPTSRLERKYYLSPNKKPVTANKRWRRA